MFVLCLVGNEKVKIYQKMDERRNFLLWRSCAADRCGDNCISLQDSWARNLKNFQEQLYSKYVEESDSIIINLRDGQMNAPMSGLTFNMNPQFLSSEVVVSVGVRYKCKFPDNFLWNQGGYLPGLQGVYNRESGTVASAACVFESRCRWDAKGKLGCVLKRCAENNPLEWSVEKQEKTQLVTDRWYSVEMVAHIDGYVKLVVNEFVLFDGICNYGFESLTGVRMSAYCNDNAALEDSHIELKNIEIFGQVDRIDDMEETKEDL